MAYDACIEWIQGSNYRLYSFIIHFCILRKRMPYAIFNMIHTLTLHVMLYTQNILVEDIQLYTISRVYLIVSFACIITYCCFYYYYYYYDHYYLNLNAFGRWFKFQVGSFEFI